MPNQWWNILVGDAGKKNSKGLRLLGLGLLGVLLIVVSNAFGGWTSPSTSSQTSPPATSTQQRQDLGSNLEIKLAKQLERIPGAGAVSVLISMESSPVKVFAQNSNEQRRTIAEKDQQSGTRITEENSTQNTIVSGEAGGLVEQEKAAEVRGVLVLAEGAGSVSVRAAIEDAVQTVLGIPAYRVSVQEGR